MAVDCFPLVLLHGWAMTPAVWRPLRQSLPAGAIVRTPALPGHDGAPAAAGADAADWAKHLLAQIPDEAVVCGWSLGALLALEMARLAPARIARLILIGGSPRFVAAPDWRHGLAEKTVSDFIAGYACAPESTLRRFLALQVLGDAQRKTVQRALGSAFDPAAAGVAAENTTKEGSTEVRQAFADGLRLLARTDLRSTVAAIEQPVLLLHGQRDALMPVTAAEWLAENFPSATLRVLSDCGHAAFLSDPRRCADDIGAFCER